MELRDVSASNPSLFTAANPKDYKGLRDFDALDSFIKVRGLADPGVKNTKFLVDLRFFFFGEANLLGPACSVEHMELCDDQSKKLIEELMAMPMSRWTLCRVKV